RRPTRTGGKSQATDLRPRAGENWTADFLRWRATRQLDRSRPAGHAAQLLPGPRLQCEIFREAAQDRAARKNQNPHRRAGRRELPTRAAAAIQSTRGLPWG